MKSVWLQNQSVGTCDVQLRVQVGVGLFRFLDLVGNPLASRANLYLDVWCVLEEGEQLQLLASAVNSLNYWVSGTLLVGDPA